MFNALFGVAQEEPEQPKRKPPQPQINPNYGPQMYPGRIPAQRNQPRPGSYPRPSRPPPPIHRRPDGISRHQQPPTHSHYHSNPHSHFIHEEEPRTRYRHSEHSQIRLALGGSQAKSVMEIDPALLELPPPQQTKVHFHLEEQVLHMIEQDKISEETEQLQWEDRRKMRLDAEEQHRNVSAMMSSFVTTYQPRPRKQDENQPEGEPSSKPSVFSSLRGASLFTRSNSHKGEAVDQYGVVPSSIGPQDSDDGQDESQSHEEYEQKEKPRAVEPEQSSWFSSFIPTVSTNDIYDRLRVTSKKTVVEESNEKPPERGEGEIVQDPEPGEPDFMQELTPSQRKKVKQFCHQTDSTPEVAVQYLIDYNWNLQLCIGRYFDDNPEQKGTGASPQPTSASAHYAEKAKEMTASMTTSALSAASDLSQRFLSWKKGDNVDGSSK